jgi:CRP-like cAMP-binding protein
MVKTAKDETDRFLAVPLLLGADEGARLAVFRALVERSAPAGTALLVQGKPNDRLWFVREGSVIVEREHPDGRVDVLARLNGPAMYGTTTFFRSSSPSATIRATSELAVGTLDHRAHAQLRREDPRAAEILSLEIVRVLSERFDLLDGRLAEMMAEHDDDHPRANEWANFRARLFEEPSI